MNILEQFSLQGKVVILTGGAGLYGRGLSAHLAEAGATLILASRNLESLQKVAEEENQRGYKVHAFQLEQGDEQSVLALRDQVVEQFGRIDGLVNNAVLRSMKGPDDDLEKLVASLRVNAVGLVALTRACGEVMCRQKSGSVVNIGSIMGMIGPNYFNYEGTDMKATPAYFYEKGGMLNLTRYYASDFGRSNVRVNCLSPGGFFNHQDPKFLERYQKMTMLGRMADSNDLGGAVVFLLSDASQYITGTNIAIDGGYTAK